MSERNTAATTANSNWIQDVQRRRKWALLALLAAAIGSLLVSESTWSSGSLIHETIEFLGIGLLLLCVLGRAWCTIYIGGRKKAELVQDGPYSVSRNPLYVFSIIGAAGVGAAAGSVLTIVLAALACYAVFAVVVLKEEIFLSDRFGAAYDDYCARVPRFWPRFSAWKDVETVETNPRLVLTSVGDGIFFFLAIPLVEGIEYLHDLGYLPVLFHLP
jgi:protein-S-isoprenylcysteine O-methyltransferase Ste14